ncbi:hypothetical protein DL89DRAFT_264062, partial [Linderina pennispora]
SGYELADLHVGQVDLYHSQLMLAGAMPAFALFPHSSPRQNRPLRHWNSADGVMVDHEQADPDGIADAVTLCGEQPAPARQ